MATRKIWSPIRSAFVAAGLLVAQAVSGQEAPQPAQQSGTQVSSWASPQSSPNASPPAPQAAQKPDYYLIAFSDERQLAVAEYHFSQDGKTLYYTTRENEKKDAPLNTVDQNFTRQLNDEMGQTFIFPGDQVPVTRSVGSPLADQTAATSTAPGVAQAVPFVPLTLRDDVAGITVASRLDPQGNRSTIIIGENEKARNEFREYRFSEDRKTRTQTVGIVEYKNGQPKVTLTSYHEEKRSNADQQKPDGEIKISGKKEITHPANKNLVDAEEGRLAALMVGAARSDQPSQTGVIRHPVDPSRSYAAKDGWFLDVHVTPDPNGPFRVDGRRFDENGVAAYLTVEREYFVPGGKPSNYVSVENPGGKGGKSGKKDEFFPDTKLRQINGPDGTRWAHEAPEKNSTISRGWDAANWALGARGQNTNLAVSYDDGPALQITHFKLWSGHIIDAQSYQYTSDRQSIVLSLPGGVMIDTIPLGAINFPETVRLNGGRLLPPPGDPRLFPNQGPDAQAPQPLRETVEWPKGSNDITYASGDKAWTVTLNARDGTITVKKDDNAKVFSFDQHGLASIRENGDHLDTSWSRARNSYDHAGVTFFWDGNDYTPRKPLPKGTRRILDPNPPAPKDMKQRIENTVEGQSFAAALHGALPVIFRFADAQPDTTYNKPNLAGLEQFRDPPGPPRQQPSVDQASSSDRTQPAASDAATATPGVKWDSNGDATVTRDGWTIKVEKREDKKGKIILTSLQNHYKFELNCSEGALKDITATNITLNSDRNLDETTIAKWQDHGKKYTAGEGSTESEYAWVGTRYAQIHYKDVVPVDVRKKNQEIFRISGGKSVKPAIYDTYVYDSAGKQYVITSKGYVPDKSGTIYKTTVKNGKTYVKVPNDIQLEMHKETEGPPLNDPRAAETTVGLKRTLDAAGVAGLITDAFGTMKGSPDPKNPSAGNLEVFRDLVGEIGVKLPAEGNKPHAQLEGNAPRILAQAAKNAHITILGL